MISALNEMVEAAMQGGNLFQFVRHSNETEWLRDMGYIRFIERSKYTAKGGSATWRKTQRHKHQRTQRLVYEITQAGFDRLNKHGMLPAAHPKSTSHDPH